jgi:hypothetical protein
MGMAELVQNALVAGIILLTIWGLDSSINFLWAGAEPTLFKGMGRFEIHLAWLFNAADIGLVVIFSVR